MKNLDLNQIGALECNTDELEQLGKHLGRRILTMHRYCKVLQLMRKGKKVYIAADKVKLDRPTLYTIKNQTPGLIAEFKQVRADAVDDLISLAIDKDKTGNTTWQIIKASYPEYTNKHSEENDIIEISESTKALLTNRKTTTLEERLNAILSDYYAGTIEIQQGERLIKLERDASIKDDHQNVQSTITINEGVRLPTK